MTGNNHKGPGVIDSSLNLHCATVPHMREIQETMANAFLVTTLSHNTQTLSPADTKEIDSTQANAFIPLQINRDSIINKGKALKKTPTGVAIATLTSAHPHKTSIEDATIRRQSDQTYKLTRGILTVPTHHIAATRENSSNQEIDTLIHTTKMNDMAVESVSQENANTTIFVPLTLLSPRPGPGGSITSKRDIKKAAANSSRAIMSSSIILL